MGLEGAGSLTVGDRICLFSCWPGAVLWSRLDVAWDDAGMADIEVELC